MGSLGLGKAAECSQRKGPQFRSSSSALLPSSGCPGESRQSGTPEIGERCFEDLEIKFNNETNTCQMFQFSINKKVSSQNLLKIAFTAAVNLKRFHWSGGGASVRPMAFCPSGPGGIDFFFSSELLSIYRPAFLCRTCHRTVHTLPSSFLFPFTIVETL